MGGSLSRFRRGSTSVSNGLSRYGRRRKRLGIRHIWDEFLLSLFFPPFNPNESENCFSPRPHAATGEYLFIAPKHKSSRSILIVSSCARETSWRGLLTCATLIEIFLLNY